jgi:DNA polymerase I-like protein with 3'-5' exonuclease and polymerase domains
MRLQPVLVRATVGGIQIDQPLKKIVADSLRDDVVNLTQEFIDAVRAATHTPEYTLNPDSSQQLGKLFFRDLRLIGKGTSTDAVNRRRMHDHPTTSAASRVMLSALDKYKTEAKFLSTYADMKIDPDGRIRCEYKQTGVQSAPGRLSSAKVMWGSGMNLQNQPDRAHQMFTADEGYCFVYFDLSQAEARVVGWLADIQTWIEQFEKARIDGEYDCHRALASEMFSIPYEKVPTHDREEDGSVTLRFIAKRCRHGLNYRMAADKLAETTGLPIHRAREAFALYHRINPELREWWAVEENTVRRTRQLVSPLGRVLRIMERVTDEAMESIIAFKPQSTIGDHVGATMYLCESDDAWPYDARICLNVHDALIALAPIPKAATVAAIMRRVAERPIIINGRQLIIPADLAVSIPDRGKHRWSSLVKVKQPDDITQLLQTEEYAA